MLERLERREKENHVGAHREAPYKWGIVSALVGLGAVASSAATAWSFTDNLWKIFAFVTTYTAALAYCPKFYTLLFDKEEHRVLPMLATYCWLGGSYLGFLAIALSPRNTKPIIFAIFPIMLLVALECAGLVVRRRLPQKDANTFFLRFVLFSAVILGHLGAIWVLLFFKNECFAMIAKLPAL
jgi:hypothetical protein